MQTERYSRGDKPILTVQTRKINGKKTVVDVFVLGTTHSGVSYELENGKWRGVLLVDRNFDWAVKLHDLDADGSWDKLELLSDDMEVVEAFRKDRDGILRPLSGKDLSDLVRQGSGRKL